MPTGLLATGEPTPLTAATALREWQFAPLVTAALLVLALGYLTGVRRVARRHPARPWAAWRTLAFLAGLGVITVATQSSLGVYDDVLFSVHMVQHLLLIMVAPALLVVGRPVTLLLHSVSNPVHAWVKRVLRSPVVTTLTWPPAATTLYCAVVVGTHLTPFGNLVLRSPAVHDAEHVLYLLAGYLFFLPVLGSEPIRRRVSMAGRYLMLLVAMPVDTATGVILMLVPHELFPAYAHTGRTWGPSLLTDLHDGGIIMWTGSDILMTLLACTVAALLIHDPRQAGQLGRWLERSRQRRLAQGLTSVGLAVPAARTVDDDQHLAAYNAYLSALGGAPAPGCWKSPRSGPQGELGEPEVTRPA
jgi:cytochrome c oxidase assembly factor CtaG